MSAEKELKELRKIGSLFETVTAKSRPFLDKCSETKYLAVTDFTRATDEYFTLAHQVLGEPAYSNSEEPIRLKLSTVRAAIESGQLSSNLIDALEGLRTEYLEQVLRPAVREYLSGNSENQDQIEGLYESALQIESLLELIHFFKKVQSPMTTS